MANENAIANWNARMAEMAKQAAKLESGDSRMMSTKSGVLSYKKQALTGNMIDAIVIDYVAFNGYWSGKYDPGNVAPPDCFAIAHRGETMAPHPNSAKPVNATCIGCPANKYGSAETGSGKACKNQFRLGLMNTTPEDLEDISKAEVAFLTVPPTSMTNWSKYVTELENTHQRPPLGVITRVAVVPHPKNQFAITFTCVEIIPDDFVPPVFARFETVSKEILFAYAKQEAAKPVAPPTNTAKFTNKFAK